MVRTRISCLAFLAFALGGCGGPQKDMGDMQSMEPPPRPKQLDRLEAFVGRWEGTMEMKMAGSPESMKATGVNKVGWACDGRYLMENMEGQMGDDKFVGIGMWGWDAKNNRYHIWWFESSGDASEGWATYNEADKSWHHEGSGHSAMVGKLTYFTGSTRFPDANTMEWSWKIWDNSWKWGEPIMEMSGTQRRK